MRSIVLFCVFFVPNWTLINNSNWHNFKTTFNKNYTTPTEERRRAHIFEENVRKIEEHNKLFEGNLTTYEKGTNQFTDWTDEELEAFFPKISDIPLNLTNNFAGVPRTRLSLPTSVDWRTKNVVTDIKDQKTCGACWAFSATGALEGVYAIKYGKPISLSEQNLIDCSTDQYYNKGCSGGLPSNAMIYVKDNGIDSEKDYPYTAAQGECRYSSQDSVLTVGKVLIIDQDEAALEHYVAQQPISIAIEATRNLQSYQKGILNDNACTNLQENLNHAVLFVGYGEENGVKYWIAKNSWGTAWGEEGYFRIIKGRNNCGINLLATFPDEVSSSNQGVLSLSLLVVSLILLEKIN